MDPAGMEQVYSGPVTEVVPGTFQERDWHGKYEHKEESPGTERTHEPILLTPLPPSVHAIHNPGTERSQVPDSSLPAPSRSHPERERVPERQHFPTPARTRSFLPSRRQPER